MSIADINAWMPVLLLPLAAAALLAIVPSYRWAARLNVVAMALTLLAAMLLFAGARPTPNSSMSSLSH